jgi:hypothetical protein
MCDDRRVATLYDILGVTDSATDDELRRAYYRAARRLHPDVNPDLDATEEMRRLNRAWAVLGNPRARRSYDLERSRPAVRPLATDPSHATRQVPDAEAEELPLVHPLARLVRPSALVLAVLLVIFVITAYAGPKSNDRNPTPASSPQATAPNAVSPYASPSLLGKCVKILPGYDAVMPCNQANDGQIVAEVVASANCPAGTRAYQLAGRAQIVCLDRAGP